MLTKTLRLATRAVGWHADGGAWPFPMVNAAGQVLGIRLRRPGGRKFAVTGSRDGLFLPSNSDPHTPHFRIAEGPTDAAALWDMGFRNPAGRPSGTGGTRLLIQLVRQRRPANVIILADNDETGRRGAERRAARCIRTWRMRNGGRSK